MWGGEWCWEKGSLAEWLNPYCFRYHTHPAIPSYAFYMGGLARLLALGLRTTRRLFFDPPIDRFIWGVSMITKFFTFGTFRAKIMSYYS